MFATDPLVLGDKKKKDTTVPVNKPLGTIEALRQLPPFIKGVAFFVLIVGGFLVKTKVIDADNPAEFSTEESLPVVSSTEVLKKVNPTHPEVASAGAEKKPYSPVGSKLNLNTVNNKATSEAEHKPTQTAADPFKIDSKTSESTAAESPTPSSQSNPENIDDTTKFKRELLSTVNIDTATIDILRDSPVFQVEGVSLKDGDSIGKRGFTLQNIRVETIPARLEDIVLTADIMKENKVVRTIKRKVGDYYTILYYDGGMEIKDKSSSLSTDIVLEGEKLTSIFNIASVTTMEDSVVFMMNILGAKKKEFYVPLGEVN